jgi:acyl carrier protein
MTKREFYSELESLIGLEPGSIQGAEPLSGIAGWDSMEVLRFIALADEKLGEVASPEAIIACQTVADLANMFPAKIT